MGRIVAVEGGVGFGVGIDAHLVAGQRVAKRREICHTRRMDQQRVECIAHTRPAGLGIVYDNTSHRRVACCVKIGMHHTGTRLDDRHLGRFAHHPDESLAASGYAQVYVSHSLKQPGGSLVGGRKQGDGGCGQLIAAQDIVDDGHSSAVGGFGIFPSFEDAGIAALETEREHIESDVGSGLVDHADDTKWYTDLAQQQSVGKRAPAQYPP